ncbi:unnamed protein product, partial [Symbiodinium sp. KB8]
MPNSRSKIIDESISLGFVIVKRSAQFESNSFDAVIRILLNSADPSLPVGHTKIYMLEAIGESLKLTNHSMELGTDRFSSSFIQMINLRIELQQSIIKFTLQHFEPLMKSPMIVDATLLSELIVSTHDKPLTETIEFVVEALSKISDSFSEDVEVSMPVEHALRDCLQIDGSPLGGISTDCVPHRGIVACQPTAHRCRNRDTGAAASPFCRQVQWQQRSRKSTAMQAKHDRHQKHAAADGVPCGSVAAGMAGVARNAGGAGTAGTGLEKLP